MSEKLIAESEIRHYLEQSLKSASKKQILSSLNILLEKFDSEFYLNEYPDVAASQMSAVLHYFAFGWKEGRRIKILETSQNTDLKNSKGQ